VVLLQRVLDILNGRSRIRPLSCEKVDPTASNRSDSSESMTPTPPPQPQPNVTSNPCKHPRVQIVSRDDDAEYVECKECGDVFESSELKDMAIEETKLKEEE
jgi:hypothetical protein